MLPTRLTRAALAVLTSLVMLTGAAAVGAPAAHAVGFSPLELRLSPANTAALSARGVIPYGLNGATVTTIGTGATRQWSLKFPYRDTVGSVARFNGSVGFFGLFTLRGETMSDLALGQTSPFAFDVSGRLSTLNTRATLFSSTQFTAPSAGGSPTFVLALNLVSNGGVTGSPLGTVFVTPV